MGLASPAIITSLNVFQPPCFCQDRKGNMFIVNGVDRPYRWDGSSSTAELAGITAPTTAPTVTAANGGNLSAGVYQLYYRYIDDEGIPSNLSPVAEKRWPNIPCMLPS